MFVGPWFCCGIAHRRVLLKARHLVDQLIPDTTFSFSRPVLAPTTVELLGQNPGIAIHKIMADITLSF